MDILIEMPWAGMSLWQVDVIPTTGEWDNWQQHSDFGFEGFSLSGETMLIANATYRFLCYVT